MNLLGGGDLEGEEGDLPPGAQVVNVTEEERAAIERVGTYSSISPVLVLITFPIVGSAWISSATCHRSVFCV